MGCLVIAGLIYRPRLKRVKQIHEWTYLNGISSKTWRGLDRLQSDDDRTESQLNCGVSELQDSRLHSLKFTKWLTIWHNAVSFTYYHHPWHSRSSTRESNLRASNSSCAHSSSKLVEKVRSHSIGIDGGLSFSLALETDLRKNTKGGCGCNIESDFSIFWSGDSLTSAFSYDNPLLCSSLGFWSNSQSFLPFFGGQQWECRNNRSSFSAPKERHKEPREVGMEKSGIVSQQSLLIIIFGKVLNISRQSCPHFKQHIDLSS